MVLIMDGVEMGRADSHHPAAHLEPLSFTLLLTFSAPVADVSNGSMQGFVKLEPLWFRIIDHLKCFA